MPWLRLDDGFAQHPKIVRLTPKDRWTWLELLCYCARYRTDGHVPAGISEVVRGATPAFLARCGQLRLLDQPDDGGDGFQVHDWHEYNPGTLEPTELEQRVAAAVEEHPDASANEIARLVGGRKQAALEAVRRFRAGSRTGSQGTTGTGPTRAGARGPVPSRPLQEPRAAAATTSGTTEPPEPNDAAAAHVTQQIEALGLNGTALALAAADPPRAQAWLELASSEATTNPAAFVLTGLRSGEWPSARARKPDPAVADPQRRERFVHGDGWRLPADELEHQLAAMGADDDELVGLLEWAADRRSAP